MASEIVINSNPREIRVALVENNQLAEIFIEHKTKKGIVGNIYKGVVTKVLPGMQVAFVDIGLERAGFLYVGDIDIIDLVEYEGEEEDNHDEVGNNRSGHSLFSRGDYLLHQMDNHTPLQYIVKEILPRKN